MASSLANQLVVSVGRLKHLHRGHSLNWNPNASILYLLVDHFHSHWCVCLVFLDQLFGELAREVDKRLECFLEDFVIIDDVEAIHGSLHFLLVQDAQ